MSRFLRIRIFLDFNILFTVLLLCFLAKLACGLHERREVGDGGGIGSGG